MGALHRLLSAQGATVTVFSAAGPLVLRFGFQDSPSSRCLEGCLEEMGLEAGWPAMKLCR